MTIPEQPATRYALTKEGVSVAYKLFGDGPHDLVFSPGWVTNIEVLLEWPDCVRFFTRLSRNFRVAVYDKQGTGLSDRVATVPTLEARMDDIDAVMRATGMERATLFGPTQGAALSALFAATFPERVVSLVAYGAFATTWKTPDWPFGEEDPREDEWERDIAENWGTEAWAHRAATVWGAESRRADPAFLRWLAKLMRFSATPTSALAFNDAFNATDVRAVLPSVGVPSLLLHRANQGEGEELEFTAKRLPFARVSELPPDDWSPYIGDPDAMVGAIEGFLAGVDDEEESYDRVLATVVFTDIVGSTEQAAELGDRAWKDLLQRHHSVVRALIGRYRGTEVDTAGDGFLATFDGPARGVRFARASTEAVRALGIEIRAGVHTGEVETIDGKVGGIAVNIGSRVSGTARASEVLVSSTVRDLVAGSGLVFEDAGEHELKGVADRWRLYRVGS